MEFKLSDYIKDYIEEGDYFYELRACANGNPNKVIRSEDSLTLSITASLTGIWLFHETLIMPPYISIPSINQKIDLIKAEIYFPMGDDISDWIWGDSLCISNSASGISLNVANSSSNETYELYNFTSNTWTNKAFRLCIFPLVLLNPNDPFFAWFNYSTVPYITDSNYVYDGLIYTLYATGEAALCGREDSTLLNITIPETINNYKVTLISMPAFSGTNIISIDIPDYIVGMDSDVFTNCTSLKNISFGGGLTEIPVFSFNGCTALETLVFPENITKIGNDAFTGCTNLKSITMYNTLKEIAWAAFNNCDNITDIYYIGTEEEWNQIEIADMNDGIKNATVHYMTPNQLSGTWVLNETLNKELAYAYSYYPSAGIDYAALVNFTSNSNSYKAFAFDFIPDSYMVYQVTDHDGQSAGWVDENYRIVNFDTTQTVSKEFYDWFIANATPKEYKVTVTETTWCAYSVYDGYEEKLWSRDDIVDNVFSGTNTFNIKSGYISILARNSTALAAKFTSNLTKVYSDWDTAIYIVDKEGTVTMTSYPCLVEGTQISLADGTTKAVEDITMSDELLVWDFYEGKQTSAKPMWIMPKQEANYYFKVMLSDNTTLNLVGYKINDSARSHRLYNVEQNAFIYPQDFAEGEHTINEFGELLTIKSIECIEDTVNYYNIITDTHYNLYAENILTSCRLSNRYGIIDMKYNTADVRMTEEEVKLYLDNLKKS